MSSSGFFVERRRGTSGWAQQLLVPQATELESYATSDTLDLFSRTAIPIVNHPRERGDVRGVCLYPEGDTLGAMAWVRVGTPVRHEFRSTFRLPNGQWYRKAGVAPQNERGLEFVGWPACIRSTLGLEANDLQMVVGSSEGIVRYTRRQDAFAPRDPLSGRVPWTETSRFASEYAGDIRGICLLQRPERTAPLELVVLTSGPGALLYTQGIAESPRGDIVWRPFTRIRGPQQQGLGQIESSTISSRLAACYYSETDYTTGAVRTGIWMVAFCLSAVDRRPGLAHIESVYDPATNTHTWQPWQPISRTRSAGGVPEPLIQYVPDALSCLQSNVRRTTLLPREVPEHRARYIISYEDAGGRWVVRRLRLSYEFEKTLKGRPTGPQLRWSVDDDLTRR